MVARRTIADLDIQDYLDGRLDPERRASLALEMRENPELAREIQELRTQDEALGMLGAEVLYEPIPDRLLETLRVSEDGPDSADNVPSPPPAALQRQTARSGFSRIAAVLLLLVIGGTGGWLGRGALSPEPDPVSMILADLESAYSFYASEDDFPVEFKPDQDNDFGAWVKRAFQRQIKRPDLTGAGYDYVGGRFLPRATISTGLFLFRDSKGRRVSVFFWPSDQPPQRKIQVSQSKSVAVRFWTDKDWGFAVLGQNDNSDIETIAESIYKFYDPQAGQ